MHGCHQRPNSSVTEGGKSQNCIPQAEEKQSSNIELNANLQLHSNTHIWTHSTSIFPLFFFRMHPKQITSVPSLFQPKREIEKENVKLQQIKMKAKKKKNTPCDLSFFLSIISSPYNLLHLNNQFDWMVLLGEYAVSFGKAYLWLRPHVRLEWLL